MVPVKTSEESRSSRTAFLSGAANNLPLTPQWSRPSRLRMPSAGDTTSWSTGQVPPPSDGVRGSHEAVSSVNTEDSQPFHSFVVLPTLDSATTLLGLPLGACSCVNGPSVRASGLRVTDCSFSSFRQKKRLQWKPRLPRTPCPRTTGTGWPKQSRGRPHRQKREEREARQRSTLGASPTGQKKHEGPPQCP